MFYVAFWGLHVMVHALVTPLADSISGVTFVGHVLVHALHLHFQTPYRFS
jgi:hypothetical protein